MNLYTCCGLITFLIANAATNLVSAQLVQVPNTGFGGADNAFPFSTPFGPMRYQQIYSAAAFPHGGTIDNIKFREVARHWFVPYGPVSIDIQIAFSYAARTVATASPTFADNIGDNFTVVLDGVVEKSHDGSTPLDSFDFVLDVENTFTYDPLRGDLLMQVLTRHRRGSFTAFDAADSAEKWQHVTTRIFADGLNSVNGIVSGSEIDPRYYGLVTQFEFSQIPEPTSMILALIAASWARFRSRR